MKGKKPELDNVIPMKGGSSRPVPPPPDLMAEGAKKVWERLAPHMERLGRLKPIYEDAFEELCAALNDIQELRVVIDLEGRTYTVKTRNGLQQKKTAAWQALLDAQNTVMRKSALFGMSPVDDKRLANTDQGDLFAMLKEGLDGTP
jgi:P27 family predicted phage terminase small subunit